MNIDDLYRMLRAGHSQLQGIVDTTPSPLIVLDGGLHVLNANRAFFDTFKVERFETIGRELYALGNGQWNIPELRILLERVIPRSAAVVDYQVEHDFPELGRRTMLLTARTLFNPDNVSKSMLLSIVDATDRLSREARSEILFGEMRHRVSNLLASAQALARQSSTEGRTAEEFRDEYLARLGNLVRSSELAFSAKPVGLKSLIETTLAPYADPTSVIITADDDFDAGPSTMTALSLVFHELATNAAKHGALSVNGGRIEIRWSLDSKRGGLHLGWAERGGPQTSKPTRHGYGTKLINSVVKHSLDGEQEQTFEPEGYSIDVFIPFVADSGTKKPTNGIENGHADHSSGSGR